MLVTVEYKVIIYLYKKILDSHFDSGCRGQHVIKHKVFYIVLLLRCVRSPYMSSGY